MKQMNNDKSLRQLRISVILVTIIVFGILSAIIIWSVNANRAKKTENEQAQALEQLELNIEKVQDSASEIKLQLESLLPKLDTMNQLVNTNKQVVNGINSVSNVSSEFIDSVEKETISLQTVLDKYIKTYNKETGTANQIVANSFDTVNKDVNDLVTVINNNNNQQNSNYSSISNQLDKLLKDTKKFIQVLTEENAEQHKALIEEMTGCDEALTKVLNEEFGNLNNQIAGIDEKFDSLSKKIETARKEILGTIEDINNGVVENLESKYKDINDTIDGLSETFVSTIESVEQSIKTLKSEDAERYAGVVASLETVSTNLSDLNKTTQNDLKLFKSSMDSLIYTFEQNIQTLKGNFDTRFGTLTDGVNSVSGNLGTGFVDVQTILKNYFDNQNTKLDNDFSELNKTANASMDKITTDEYLQLVELLNTIGGHNEEINDALGTAAEGKELLIEALKAKNITVPEGASLADLADLIKTIPTEIVAGDIALPVVVDTFHHHTLGTIGDADNTSNEGGQYADDYRAEATLGCFTTPVYHEHVGNNTTEGGCFNIPVYHVHTGNSDENGGCYTKPIYHKHDGNLNDGGGCYTSSEPHHHIGSGDANGVLVENSCYESYQNREVVGSHREGTGHWYGWWRYDDNKELGCEQCGQPLAGHPNNHQEYRTVYDYGYVTRYRLKCGYTEGQIVHALGCGMTEETIIGYDLGCGKVEGETIDYYEPDCGMTEETIIGYDRSCGINDNTLVNKHFEY